MKLFSHLHNPSQLIGFIFQSGDCFAILTQSSSSKFSVAVELVLLSWGSCPPLMSAVSHPRGVFDVCCRGEASMRDKGQCPFEGRYLIRSLLMSFFYLMSFPKNKI